jgi:hypothetical protein
MEGFDSRGQIASRVKEIEHCGCCLVFGPCYVSAGLADAVLGFTQDLCSRCQINSRSDLERISYPLPATVQADTWDMVVSQMKKTSPSFTFEVKRSKLSSQQPSKFQRFVLEPKQKLSVPKRHAADQGLSEASKTEAPVVGRRILESVLITPVAPHTGVAAEPQVDEPVQEMTAPVIRRRRKVAIPSLAFSAEAEKVQGKPAVEESLVPEASAVLVPLPIFRGKRKAVASAEQLPRGERWKRRLPRAAW